MKSLVAAILVALGLYIMTWAFQSAWLSATPVADPEIYKTRALFLFPLSILIVSVGAAIFFCGRQKRVS
jgi:nitrogen fixation-related uncharacterized protein